MRIIAIIVDLFVLLAFISFSLYFGALGSAAPHEELSRPALFELTGDLSGPEGTRSALPIIDVEGILLTPENALAHGDVVDIPADENARRFLVRGASPEAKLILAINRFDVEAFSYDQLSLRITRLYSSPGTAVSSEPVGKAQILSIAVGDGQ